jgi:undecaprenyl diphosphate synthase
MKHLAIILDGNRRWAKENGKTQMKGHQAGYENIKRIGKACLKRDIEHLTVFAFSTENWNRSEREVGYLMDLLHHALTKEVDYFHENNVRLNVVGRREGLPKKIADAIEAAEKKTAENTAGQFNICLNYGGRAELVEGVKSMLKKDIDPSTVDEKVLADHLWTGDLPDPEMIVRTSGEKRLSGFLTWSSVYSELYFTDTYWPDFSEDDLDEVLAEYERRERRYGE